MGETPDMATVSELTEDVWRIDLGQVNAYLVDDDVLTLVDAGWPGNAGAIREAIEGVGFEVSEIERVLVTHYDLDHVGALDGLAPDLDARVFVGRADAEMLTGERRPPLKNRKGALQRAIELAFDGTDLPVEEVGDRETVGSFTAFSTPGHTPGHVAYVNEALGVAMVGDLVTESGGVLRPAPWVLNYDSGQVRESLRTLIDEAPPFRIVCPGHGEPIAGDVRDALTQAAGRSGIPI